MKINSNKSTVRPWMQLVLALLLVSGIPAAAVAQDLQTVTSYQAPYQGPVKEVNVPALKLKWSQAVDNTEGSVLDNGSSVFALKNGQLVAIHAATGKLAWKFGTKLQGGFQYEKGRIYVSAADGTVYAVDAAKGAKVWASKTKYANQSRLTVSGGIVFVESYAASGLAALDAQTGKSLWKFTELGVHVVQTVGDAVICTGVVDGAWLSDQVYALDRTTGKKLWKELGYHEPPIAIDKNIMYVPVQLLSLDDPILAKIDQVDIKTGKVVSTQTYERKDTVPAYSQWSQKVLAHEGKLYIQQDNQILMYPLGADPSKTTPVSYPGAVSDRNESLWVAGPYQNRLFLAAQNRLYAWKTIAATSVDFTRLGSPVSRIDLIGNGLFLGQENGTLTGYNIQTAKPLFKVTAATDRFGQTRLIGNTLIVQAEGKLLAYGLSSALSKQLK